METRHPRLNGMFVSYMTDWKRRLIVVFNIHLLIYKYTPPFLGTKITKKCIPLPIGWCWTTRSYSFTSLLKKVIKAIRERTTVLQETKSARWKVWMQHWKWPVSIILSYILLFFAIFFLVECRIRQAIIRKLTWRTQMQLRTINQYSYVVRVSTR